MDTGQEGQKQRGQPLLSSAPVAMWSPVPLRYFL